MPKDRNALPSIISLYFNMRKEMSVQDGLVFKEERLFVPIAVRRELIRKIQNSHLGANGCFNRARECLYWPNMTRDVKNHVANCEACKAYERSQIKETLMSHDTPSALGNGPWQFLAADLFELQGRNYLVTSDYYSDFFELDHFRSTSSVSMIQKFKVHIATHGIPEQLFRDNGPQFAF